MHAAPACNITVTTSGGKGIRAHALLRLARNSKAAIAWDQHQTTSMLPSSSICPLLALAACARAWPWQPRQIDVGSPRLVRVAIANTNGTVTLAVPARHANQNLRHR